MMRVNLQKILIYLIHVFLINNYNDLNMIFDEIETQKELGQFTQDEDQQPDQEVEEEQV